MSGLRSACEMVQSLPLKDLRKSKGLTLKDLAELVGSTPQHINRLERGESQMTTRWITKFSTALDCDPSVFVAQRLPAPSHNISIPVYETPVSAGPGSDIVNQEIEPLFHYDLPREWLREKFRSIPDPQFLIIVRVTGISMRPLINSGDLVLVNCAVRSFMGDAIYLLRSLDILQLKRVILDYSTNKYQILSENPSYAAVKMESPEIEIQGRADWVFKMEEL